MHQNQTNAAHKQYNKVFVVHVDATVLQHILYYSICTKEGIQFLLRLNTTYNNQKATRYPIPHQFSPWEPALQYHPNCILGWIQQHPPPLQAKGSRE